MIEQSINSNLLQKINKNNAWKLTIIDNMNNLCRSHHKTLKNFQIICPSLEASSRIYELRVDSVYTAVVEMSRGMGRMRGMFKTFSLSIIIYRLRLFSILFISFTSISRSTNRQ